MKSRIRASLSIGLALVMSFSFLASVPAVSANQTVVPSDGYSYDASITITTFDRVLTIANRIIDNTWYNGPMDSMVKASNGDYLGFIREGTSHAAPGDYGAMKLYRSTNDAFDWSYNATLMNVSTRDVRNYASGITDTGRVFVFFSIYDTDNGTWPNPLEYKYSDDDGATWSANATMIMPTLAGFVPTNTSLYGAGTFGGLRTIGGGKIGLCYFAGNNTNYTQTRFAYSADDGVSWNHSVMGSITGPYPATRSETDFAYLGDNKLVALSREDNAPGPDMFTSVDNGVTWTFWGPLPFLLAGSTSASMSIVIDDLGERWVLAIFYQGSSFHYSIAYGPDLPSAGLSAWSTPLDTSDIWGAFPVTIFDPIAGSGFIMSEYETGASDLNVLMFNLTAEITRSTYTARITSLLQIIGIMFAIGIVVGVIAEGTKSLRKEKMPTTQEMVKSVLNMVIYIVIGMALIGVVYTALG